MRARAVTGETGFTLMGGIDLQNLRVNQYDGSRSGDIWAIEIPDVRSTKLGNLFGTPAYDFLANYVFQRGHMPNSACMVGKIKTTKMIRIDGVEYRADGHKRVHSKVRKVIVKPEPPRRRVRYYEV